MKPNLPVKIFVTAALFTFTFAVQLFAQEIEPEIKKVNFGYSRNPATKSKTSEEKTANPEPKKKSPKTKRPKAVRQPTKNIGSRKTRQSRFACADGNL